MEIDNHTEFDHLMEAAGLEKKFHTWKGPGLYDFGNDFEFIGCHNGLRPREGSECSRIRFRSTLRRSRSREHLLEVTWMKICWFNEGFWDSVARGSRRVCRGSARGVER